MALALLLRSAGRSNYSGLIRCVKPTPVIKTFTSAVAGQHLKTTTFAVASKPLLLQLSKPLARTITVSAPRLSGSHGNHAALWKAERVLSASLLALLPAAFLMPSQISDALLAIALVLHAHWGIEAIVVDYVRPSIFGALVPKLSLGALYVLSIAALAGMLNLVYNDIGVAQAIQKLWAVRHKEPEPEPQPTKGKQVKNVKK